MERMRRRQWLADCSLALLALGAGGHAGAAAVNGQQILVVGDSLSAEYGLAAGSGWVALLQARLQQQQRPQQVRNASISGDTTAGGRARLAALLQELKPGIVIIELGGNDALRGLPLKATRDNLLAMTEMAQRAGAKVLILGMQLPPNYGTRYGREFAELFEQVARERKAAVVPFLLKGVADRPDANDWFQADRIHPLAKAHPLMLDTVWPALRKLL
jgi:acyl-CoA thioesterase-1